MKKHFGLWEVRFSNSDGIFWIVANTPIGCLRHAQEFAAKNWPEFGPEGPEVVAFRSRGNIDYLPPNPKTHIEGRI